MREPDTLLRDLKQRLGIKGWVMSDWRATHSFSIMQGLDLEMPADNHMGAKDTQGQLRGRAG